MEVTVEVAGAWEMKGCRSEGLGWLSKVRLVNFQVSLWRLEEEEASALGWVKSWPGGGP